MLDLRAGRSPCQKNYSGGSRGGARVPPLFLDQTVARRAKKSFFVHVRGAYLWREI